MVPKVTLFLDEMVSFRPLAFIKPKQVTIDTIQNESTQYTIQNAENSPFDQGMMHHFLHIEERSIYLHLYLNMFMFLAKAHNNINYLQLN